MLSKTLLQGECVDGQSSKYSFHFLSMMYATQLEQYIDTSWLCSQMQQFLCGELSYSLRITHSFSVRFIFTPSHLQIFLASVFLPFTLPNNTYVFLTYSAIDIFLKKLHNTMQNNHYHFTRASVTQPTLRYMSRVYLPER